MLSLIENETYESGEQLPSENELAAQLGISRLTQGEARRRIEALAGLPPLCPDSPEWYGQMAAFPLPACDAAALQRWLYDEYRIEVPVIDWGGQQLVRVSIQGYNTEADVEALTTALADLLASRG